MTGTSPAPLQVAATSRIAVVIPCYRTGERVLDVLTAIPETVSRIYCIDDGCPEKIGDTIEKTVDDSRVAVLRHDRNLGVGAATVTGYRAALRDGADIVVKIDGDGQMDAADLPRFIQPILNGRADYTKGNRFFRLEDIRSMPVVRIVGNALLTFLAKLSTGYWNIFDPTNGYTAVHSAVLEAIPLDQLSERYFFESDMLFRLSTIRAVVHDVPMKAKYGAEQSNLRIGRVILPFLCGHSKNTVKRLFYSYYLRDFQLASVELILGLALTAFGVVFGAITWNDSAAAGTVTPAGSVMLAALPIILGVQMLLAALNYDISSIPTKVLHTELDAGASPTDTGDAGVT